jgi:hypothetical protein
MYQMEGNGLEKEKAFLALAQAVSTGGWST